MPFMIARTPDADGWYRFRLQVSGSFWEPDDHTGTMVLWIFRVRLTMAVEDDRYGTGASVGAQFAVELPEEWSPGADWNYT